MRGGWVRKGRKFEGKRGGQDERMIKRKGWLRGVSYRSFWVLVMCGCGMGRQTWEAKGREGERGK